MTRNLENEFHEEMIRVYDRARKECRYTATRFMQMVTDRGGLSAAKSLIASPHISEGLTRLWQERRLDISMEATLLREPWCQLFSPEELAVARKRLDDLGFTGH